MLNFTYLHVSQFIEYYTRLTQERHRVDDNEGVKKKEAKRQEKNEKKEKALQKKNEGRKNAGRQKLKMKKINPHSAYGNFLSNSRFKSSLGFRFIASCLTVSGLVLS